MVLAIGAILGLISVVFGAYAEHGLREAVSDEHFRYLMTALRYNQIHAAVIAAIGLAFLSGRNLYAVPALRISAMLFIAGTVLFSFTIYFAVWSGNMAIVTGTPFGGITIMAAWVLLAVGGLQARKLKGD